MACFATLFDEIRRRRVGRVAAAYAAIAWLLVKVASTPLVRRLNLPGTVPAERRSAA